MDRQAPGVLGTASSNIKSGVSITHDIVVSSNGKLPKRIGFLGQDLFVAMILRFCLVVPSTQLSSGKRQPQWAAWIQPPIPVLPLGR